MTANNQESIAEQSACDFNHIQSVLSDMYSNADSTFAAAVTVALQDNYNQSISIDTMNSGDCTDYECESGYGTANYEYIFGEDDCLSEIVITPEDTSIEGWRVNATSEMADLYRKVMAYNRLMENVNDLESLSDKAIFY
ncbi:hypothetical protein [uncultured Psychrobacter sp.]|uniref:hypothetical protein n=1 Tax=uncultured Psychrobacter sp. TaxID=259303 RepID=UPI0030D9EF57